MTSNIFQSPQKPCPETVAVTEPSAPTEMPPDENMVTDDRSPSTTSIDNTISRSDLDKDEQLDDISVCESTHSRPRSGSRPSTARVKSNEVIIKKQIDNVETASRPGTNKARPIPEMPNPPSFAIPGDPDKDSPDVVVS